MDAAPVIDTKKLREIAEKAFIVAFMNEGGAYMGDMSAKTVLSLLDALEKAREELTVALSAHGANARVRRRIRRVKNFDTEKASAALSCKLALAQKDAKDARALLEELAESSWTQRAIRARIEKELDK